MTQEEIDTGFDTDEELEAIRRKAGGADARELAARARQDAVDLTDFGAGPPPAPAELERDLGAHLQRNFRHWNPGDLSTIDDTTGERVDGGLQEDGSFVFVLEKPVEFPPESKKLVRYIRFREPTGKEWNAQPLEPQRWGELLKWLCRMGNVPPQVFHLARGRDAKRLCEVALGFFYATPERIGRLF